MSCLSIPYRCVLTFLYSYLGTTFSYRNTLKFVINPILFPLQAVILLQFNDYKEITIDNLSKFSGIHPENLKRQLKVFVFGPYQVGCAYFPSFFSLILILSICALFIFAAS